MNTRWTVVGLHMKAGVRPAARGPRHQPVTQNKPVQKGKLPPVEKRSQTCLVAISFKKPEYDEILIACLTLPPFPAECQLEIF